MNKIIEILQNICKECKLLITPPEEKPYPEEHACRLEDPKQFDIIRRQNNAARSNGKRLDFIFGVKAGKSKLQAIRYPKNIWNVDDAQKHCKLREGSFEAAKKE